MSIYQSWHFSLMPKLEYNYFLEQVGKLGLKGGIKAYMSRLRQVYKGLLDFSSFEEPTAAAPLSSAPSVAKPAASATFNEEAKTEQQPTLQRISKPAINEEDLELENALNANEDAHLVDDDEYFGEKEAAKVRIDPDVAVEKKRGLEGPEKNPENIKKYKLDINNSQM